MVEYDEWNQWAKFYGRMFPTAGEAWIREMCTRMIRTLAFDGATQEMGGVEYFARVMRLRDAINALPPDANNVLMRG